MRLFEGFLPYDEQNGWQKLQTLLEAYLPAGPGSWMLSAPPRQAGRGQQALWASIWRMRLFEGFLPYDEQNGWQKLQTLLEAYLPAGPGGRGQQALWASICGSRVSDYDPEICGTLSFSRTRGSAGMWMRDSGSHSIPTNIITLPYYGVVRPSPFEFQIDHN